MENEDYTLDFMGYKAMCHCRPIIQRLHNMRDPKIVHSEKHIDTSRPHETILDCGTLEKCYEQIFGEAVKNYNAKQKRKDRRIENYLKTILNDKRQGKHKNIKADGSRKPAYEMIIQLGNRDNRPDDEEVSQVLKDFCNYLTEIYPNIVPIGIYLHNDEFSIDEETSQKVFSPVHIHFDYVYVAHLGKSLKTGMDLQSSMSGALAEMGFVTAKGKGTAQQQFEESVRHDLQDFAEKRGIKIDRTPGEKHSHKQKPVYQQMKENEKKDKWLSKKEHQLKQDRTDLDKKIESFNQKFEQLEKDIQANTEKSLDLFIKESKFSKKEIEQRSKQSELERQKIDLQSRETMVKIKESNNKFQHEKNEKKELELSEREKVVELGEIPLLKKQKELDELKNEIDQKSKIADKTLQDAQTIQAENERASKNLELEQNDLDRDKNLFKTSAKKVDAYIQICDEVERNNMSIDSEISVFNNNRSEAFTFRFNKFVGNVKKIVTAITTELNWYKAAFKDFWNKTSKDFRHLADLMDRNNCEKFSDYNKKFYNGELDYQIQEKNQIKQQHTVRQKKINDDYEWDR
ncbi:MAG: hypothetical protein UH788_10670 [Treponemataceae bacterium]|nr:hypothetical protein [Treponemataceae bacterium]